MYLSLLKLNLSLRKTREILINPYTLHQAVYRAFPDKSNGGPGRVLYRVDQNRRSGAVSLLVQSEKAPAWTKATYLGECLLEKAEFKPFAPRIMGGQRLYFRLRANPSVKKQVEGKKNGYRMGLMREADQFKWLHKKADESGFMVVTCQAMPGGIIHNERGQEDRRKLRHYAIRFEGMLKVVNPDIFTATLNNGIGSAKGFGFGLLSIAPVKG
jgi:CRISPR system Cascade subunit CasE